MAGTAVGNYPQADITIFKAAIDTADAVLKDEEATQKQVDAALTKLEVAVTAFEATVIKETKPEVKKEALQAAVTAAQKQADEAVAGTTEGNYPQAAIDAYKVAIKNAKEVLDSTTATQGEVNAAVTSLTTLKMIFEASKVVNNVNKSALEAAIKAAEIQANAAVAGTANGNYPQMAIDAYKATIENAKEVLNNTTATQAEVNGAASTLAIVKAAFEASKIVAVVNKEGLQTAITAAEAQVNEAVAGTSNGNYPQATIDAYKAAIANAKEVLNNTASTQEQITEAATQLATAKTVFEASKIAVPLNIQELQTAVIVADFQVAIAVPGTADGNYPQAAIDAYKVAITAAKAVLNNTAATQAQIDKAVTDLAAAKTTFENAKIVINVSKSALQVAITAAEAQANAAVAGTADGNYPQAAIDAYRGAITVAKGVLNNTAATQAQVDKAATDLATAKTTFENAKIVISVNKGTLEAAITAAEAQANAAVAGTADGNYPQAAIDAYRGAITAAKGVLNNTAATQAQVDKAVADLATAKTTFEAAVVKGEFLEIISID